MKRLSLCLFFLSFIYLTPAFSLQIGLILDKGGKDDRSFNTAAYEGAQRAQKELGVNFRYVEAQDTLSLENLHRNFARRNFDLIIGVGFAQKEAVEKVAKQFPNKKFAIVDATIKGLPNVASLVFAEHEGSFLVGALAAIHSPSNHVGFIGGMDIPLIRRFEMGYQAGARYINSKVKVTSNFIGVSGEAWNNPTKARELALAQFKNKVDVIFVAAGASGSGVFDAAQEQKKLAIGVDSNQNYMRPGVILTSMQKRVDVAVFNQIQNLKNMSWKPGLHLYNLTNQGVSWSLDEHNKGLIKPKTTQQLEQISKDIQSGKIQVPDFYNIKK